MNKLFIALLAILWTSAAVGEQKIIPLYQINSAEGTFLQVPLRHDVYRFIRQENGRSLVAIDAEQNPLPARITVLNPPTAIPQTEVTSKPLAFFPVAADATPETLTKLHSIQTNIQGNKIELLSSDKTLSNATPEFYLLDISQIDQAITRLIIEWEGQASNQYLEIQLEATHNLQDWVGLTHATLVQVNQQEQTLKHNHINIKIAKNEYRYLRLKIIRGAENLHITSITAEQKVDLISAPEKLTESWSLVGEFAKVQTSVYLPSTHSKASPVSAWEYIRNETTPCETIAIDLGTHTYGDSIRLFSRASSTQNWQLQHQGIWFQTQVGAQWQKSEAINLYHNRDTFWRLELSTAAKNIASPQLMFSWQPLYLQIVANNKPPFMLAINNDSNNYSREQVFNQIVSTATPTWIPAYLTGLNVSPDIVATPEKSINWRQWLFWLALGLAVAVLLIFSLNLLKQLSPGDTKQ